MGYVSHNTAVEWQLNADVLLLPLRKEPEYRAVLPGKLFEYLASRRPILGIGQKDGAMSMILDRTNTGIVLDWNDKESLRNHIDICWTRHLEGQLKTDSTDISGFTRRSLTRQMAELFDKTVKDSSFRSE